MINAKVDMKKLEASLQRYAKRFGDTTAQAVTRWGVSTCRELANETQAVRTDGKTPYQIQRLAIIFDAYNVLMVVDSLKKNKTGSGYTATNQGKSYFVSSKKVLLSEAQIRWWVEINRTRRRARTAELDKKDRKIVAKTLFNKAIKKRTEAAGMAKGGWIGAGNDIGKAQKGSAQFTIKASFLKYAQKHSKHGSATIPKEGWNPSTRLTNKVPHVASTNVLAANAFSKAARFGLSKTIRWYSETLRAINQKTK